MLKFHQQQSERPFRVGFCGRPNVGKSSLFNRLVGKKRAIVLDEPGITRDVFRTEISLHDDYQNVELADLAGLENLVAPKTSDINDKEILNVKLQNLAAEAAKDYLRETDLILFVIDARQGVTPADEELAKLLRTFGKETIVVLSKVEGPTVGKQGEIDAACFGWQPILQTSAEHNLGIDNLREEILRRTPKKEKAEVEASTEDKSEEVATEEDRIIHIGVYGRPNVGKSTLVNWLLKEKRMITSDVPGTTVDTIDARFEVDGRKYQVCDTAGIRRRSKTEQGAEVISVLKSLESLKRVDIALFLIDGYVGFTDQDEKVAGELVKSGRPVVILVNKWDLCKIKREAYSEKLRDEVGFLEFAPVIFMSSLKQKGLDNLWDLIDEILEQRRRTATTGELNRFISTLEQSQHPKGLKVYYANQISKNPPTIRMFVNNTKKVQFSFERYVKNRLREQYGWMGSPLRLFFKARSRSKSHLAR